MKILNIKTINHSRTIVSSTETACNHLYGKKILRYTISDWVGTQILLGEADSIKDCMVKGEKKIWLTILYFMLACGENVKFNIFSGFTLTKE